MHAQFSFNKRNPRVMRTAYHKGHARVVFYFVLLWLYAFIVDLHHLLTHWGRLTHICVSKLTIAGSDNGLSPSRPQAIIWTKCWNIVNWTHGSKIQWNFNRSLYIFIKKSAFQYVFWKMAGIFLSASVLNMYWTRSLLLSCDCPSVCGVSV